MAGKSKRRESAHKALYSGELDVEGMDDVLELYRDLFDLTEAGLGSGVLDQKEIRDEEARMRLNEGFTLIDPGALLPGHEELSAVVDVVLRVLAQHSEDPGSLTGDLAGILDDPVLLSRLARTFLCEGEEAVRRELLAIEGANPEVVMFVIFNALKGFFLRAADRCEGLDISAWEKSNCPVCGGEPAVAYTMGEGGIRFLICFRCETHWRYWRLNCPYCGQEDPRESGYLFSEDPVYRTLSANVCSECKAYIKSWKVEGNGLGDTHPEVEDLKTPGFDRAVEGEGYSRGAPNIYGIWIGFAGEDGEDAD